MISMLYSYRFLAQRNQQQLQLIQNIETAFSYLLKQKERQAVDEVIDLYQLGQDSIHIQTKPWGLFEVATVKAFHNRQKLQKSALLGHQQSNKVALQVLDGFKPLVVCGKTQLKGDVYRPRAGIKSATVANIPYAGKTLVDGKSLPSAKQLPRLDSILLEQQLNYFLSLPANETQLTDSVYQSFEEEALVFQKKNIHLKSHISGHIIIKADSIIRVHPSAIIEDAILVAPFIELQSGFKGNLQLFATEKVTIHDGVQLTYPSVVSLLEAHQFPNTGFDIQIGKQFKLDGLLLATRLAKAPKIPKVKIESAQIMGDVFCKGPLDIRGVVQGNITCRNFQLRLEGKTYNNYLLDTQINANAKPKAYLSPHFYLETHEKGIVKWLN
jgi:cytoskeletal protein CcmA (bactofilin family)